MTDKGMMLCRLLAEAAMLIETYQQCSGEQAARVWEQWRLKRVEIERAQKMPCFANQRVLFGSAD